MNDEDNEFDDFDDDNIENFDSFDSDKTTIGDLIRENPILKFIIFGIVVVCIILIFIFVRSKEDTPQSSLPATSEVSSPPGTEDISDTIRNALLESDQERLETAERTGGSALPTLIEPPVGVITLPPDPEDEEDPLQRWRKLQQERLEQEAQRSQVVEPESTQDGFPEDQIQALADAMAAQMQSILDRTQGDIILTSTVITPDNYMDQFREIDVDNEEGEGNNIDIGRILIPAGDIEYGQILIEANSDIPGPVLALMASGPLKGSRLLGSFRVEREKIVLSFNTIVIDGISAPTNAVAIDPQTSIPGMASEVDRRYFTRIALPAAAAFIEGAAEAISQSGRTTITVTGNSATSVTDNIDLDSQQEFSAGIEEAAQVAGQILQQRANQTPILVKLNAGTPIGILFLQPVIEP